MKIFLIFSIFILSFTAREAGAVKDPGLRVIVEPGSQPHTEVNFPHSSKPWQLVYKFIVPPLPKSKTWAPKGQVFYLWGDVDFDIYGSQGTHPISNYISNQIVPQLMVGDAFAGNRKNDSPIVKEFDHWVIEAQYYWKNKDGKPYDLAGKPMPAVPGELITTQITYDPIHGEIFARIFSATHESSIRIPRPFLNETAAPFSSWREFFQEAEAKGKGPVKGQAVVNAESHYVDECTMCSILPFEVREMKGPQFPTRAHDFTIRTEGVFTCEKKLAELNFLRSSI